MQRKPRLKVTALMSELFQSHGVIWGIFDINKNCLSACNTIIHLSSKVCSFCPDNILNNDFITTELYNCSLDRYEKEQLR